ncbi:hypothetical protein [uncultured Shewanella sp.]|uniref:hypothetical protein n=1 Tax=uncultured Shewanella sp. TaxID=173975 RepID=UPI002617DA8E|nr:hypothetical protein [uncultured Shewanella sp.]
MLLRRNPLASNQSVDTFVTFGFRDEVVERPWMVSQRVTEVSAQKPAAGNLLK